ncbi:GNAT family N-acetyltransferase [Nocardia sp. NPDC052566]|uniref:GNAT family N-acetyltransferase n=1 Tax=Nocardia sp. NPDC052566 TaxID=3364330 RepID=UPI0037CBABB5
MTTVLTEAEATAEQAARRAGVTIRSLSSMDELRAVCDLCDAMWQAEPTDRPLQPALLRALTKAGGYVAGAFDGAEMVGVGVGFHGAPADALLHSHITGVIARMRGRDVGFAVKTHQRAWALRRGVTTIGWTFDPLVRRNAYFNIAKLGATPVEYLPDFYGPMADGFNAGDATDRLLISWDLRSPAVAAACGDHVRQGVDATNAAVALDISPDGAPVRRPVTGPAVLITVPADITRLRAADPDLAKRWRIAVREALTDRMTDGAHITGFDRHRGYVLTKEHA